MAATDMNDATPLPDRSTFGLQMEGLATALLYAIAFSWFHLEAVAAGTTATLISTKALAVGLVGLIVIPLVVALPMVGLRRALVGAIPKGSAIAASLPFAQVALYGLQCLLVWVVTREAYALLFTAAPTVTP